MMTYQNLLVKFKHGRNDLVEAILEKYDDGKLPATHARGSSPIDGIFCPEGIHITKGGYVDHLDCPGNHCALYADILIRQLIGEAKDRRTRQTTS